jgi:hypothetical protein
MNSVTRNAAVVQSVFGDGAELARADADGGKVGGEVHGARQGPISLSRRFLVRP